MNNSNQAFLSHFSDRGTKFFNPSTIPHCLCRNIFDNSLSYMNKAPLVCANEAANIANIQAQLFIDSVQSSTIPSTLLTDALYKDILSTSPIVHRSTIISLTNTKNSFIHTSGIKLDQLVLRELGSYSSRSIIAEDSGFTVNLGNGNEIVQLLSAGAMYLESIPHIIARTSSEVFHLKTTILENFANQTERRSIDKLLEPVQKWQMPVTIADMSSSSLSSWSYASLISTEGHMFSWTPQDGVRSCRENQATVPTNRYMRVGCSLHPQVSYVTSASSLMLFDMRSSRSSAEPLAVFDDLTGVNTNLKSTNSIQAVMQHPTDLHKVFISVSKKLLVVDRRFPKTALSERNVPDTHSILQYRTLASSAGVCLGGSTTGAQILAHVVGTGSAGRNRQSSLGMLGAATLAGAMSSDFTWEVEGFPVVDADLGFDGVSAASVCSPVSLTGFDLVSCDDDAQDKSCRDSVRQNTGARRGRETVDLAAGRHAREFMLVQQSSVGDVYAQKLLLADWSDGARTNTIGQQGSGGLASPISRAVKNEGSFGARNGDAAVQLDLPVGVRSVPLGSESPLLVGRVERKAVPVALKGRVLRDTRTELDVQASLYPHSSRAMRKTVPEDSMRGVDLLKVVPQDLRTDLPPLFRDKITFVRKLSAPLEDDEDIETFMAHNVIERLLARIRKHNYMSLWEVWKFVVMETKQRVQPTALRRYLVANSDVTESAESHTDETLLRGLCDWRCVEPHMQTSSCNCANSAAHCQSSRDIACCDEKTCVAPHLLMYHLSETFLLAQSQPFVREVSLFASQEPEEDWVESRRPLDGRTKAAKRLKAEAASSDAAAAPDEVAALFCSQNASSGTSDMFVIRRASSGSNRGTDITPDMVAALSDHWDSYH